jgi:hypothetical protein
MRLQQKSGCLNYKDIQGITTCGSCSGNSFAFPNQILQSMQKAQAIKTPQSIDNGLTFTGYLIVVVMAVLPFGMIVWKMIN